VEFEFDVNKSAANEKKHGVDLITAQRLWDDPCLIEGPGISIDEPRWLVVGRIDGVFWTACFTYRGDKIRLIECRRSRKEERQVYELSK